MDCSNLHPQQEMTGDSWWEEQLNQNNANSLNEKRHDKTTWRNIQVHPSLKSTRRNLPLFSLHCSCKFAAFFWPLLLVVKWKHKLNQMIRILLTVSVFTVGGLHLNWIVHLKKKNKWYRLEWLREKVSFSPPASPCNAVKDHSNDKFSN